MWKKLFVITLFIVLGSIHCEPQAQRQSSTDTQGRLFDLSSLLYGHRYRPYPYGGGGYGGYPGYGGSYGGYGPGYGTNFIGGGGYGGYGGQSGNGGLNSYYGYKDQNRYQGGGNLGYGYYDPDLFENRNVRPQYTPSGYRGYN